jgi:putative thioredoxin
MVAIDITDETFEAEVIEKSSQVTVVVDLWAPWCGPCKTLGPIIESVVDATEGKVILAKVNIDENPAIGQAFKVQSIPAVYALNVDPPCGCWFEVVRVHQKGLPSWDDVDVRSQLTPSHRRHFLCSQYRAHSTDMKRPSIMTV